MNWLAIALWVTPLAVLGLIGKLHEMATQPKPIGVRQVPSPPAVNTTRDNKRPHRDAFGDSMIIGAVTDNAIIGGMVGGDIRGGLVGKAIRDVIRTPYQGVD